MQSMGERARAARAGGSGIGCAEAREYMCRAQPSLVGGAGEARKIRRWSVSSAGAWCRLRSTCGKVHASSPVALRRQSTWDVLASSTKMLKTGLLESTSGERGSRDARGLDHMRAPEALERASRGPQPERRRMLPCSAAASAGVQEGREGARQSSWPVERSTALVARRVASCQMARCCKRRGGVEQVAGSVHRGAPVEALRSASMPVERQARVEEREEVAAVTLGKDQERAPVVE